MFEVDAYQICRGFIVRLSMDYKEMYLKMVRASEQAIRILVEAQRECEELYISQPDPQLIVLKKDEKESR